jgi:hypothetical protein
LTLEMEMDTYAQRAQELCLQYLQDPGNYPIIDGEVAFWDVESYTEFSGFNIPRPTEHLIDNWIVKFYADKGGIHWIVENAKYVGKAGQYNLLNLLERGNSAATIPYWQREQGHTGMHYYWRYKTRWFWHRYYREPMRSIFKSEIKVLIHEAVEYSLDEAARDMKEMIGWEV